MLTKTHAGLATLALISAVQMGCANPSPTPDPVGADGRVTIAAGGTALVFDPAIDRVVSFSGATSPELLFTQLLTQAPSPDESYTFYGGAYTWTAPQGGDLGWVGPDGAPRVWPPDPAMDTGPSAIEMVSTTTLQTLNPTSRLGLVENKNFHVQPDGALVGFALTNLGDEPRTAGTWINTACFPDSVMAVRIDGQEGLDAIYGWDQTSIDRFRSITTLRSDNWALVDLSAADWEGGIKVYIPTPAGERPTIALHRDGYWFHRTQVVTETAAGSVGRLEEVGEGTVAVYIQPADTPGGAWIIEAELLGPIEDIEPGRSAYAEERWRIVRQPGDADPAELQLILE